MPAEAGSRFVTRPGELRPAGESQARLTVTRLLADLGVSDCSKEEQRQAVAGWLFENEPDVVLRAGLIRRDLIDP